MNITRKRYKFSKLIQKQLSDIRELDNWHALIAILYDYGIISVAVILFFIQPWFYPISIILIGSRQRALATLLHESAHCCLAKSRYLNKFIGTYLSAYLIMQEYNTYRDSHVKQHHAYLGDRIKDPDYRYHIDEQLYHVQSSTSFLKNFILKPLLMLKIPSYLWYLVTYRMKPSKRYFRSFMTMFVYWAAIIAICYHYNVLLYLFILWFIPLITSSAVIGWFNELAEHYPLVGKNDIDLHMTRNRFSHWLEHFLCNTHNENYHLVHHLYPTIPFWKLKKAHDVLCQDAEYARLNENMGGIFISGNHNLSLIGHLLSVPVLNDRWYA